MKVEKECGRQNNLHCKVDNDLMVGQLKIQDRATLEQTSPPNSLVILTIHLISLCLSFFFGKTEQ